jgi:hypothetical protein
MLHNMRAPPVAWRYALLNLCPLWRGSIHAGLHRAVYATVHVESQREQVERVSLELAGHDGGLRRGACEEGPAKRGLRRGACEEGPAKRGLLRIVQARGAISVHARCAAQISAPGFPIRALRALKGQTENVLAYREVFR